jgi:hypothetical protein
MPISSDCRQEVFAMTRRELLLAIGAVPPVMAAAARGDSAYGFSQRAMPAEIAKLYARRCAEDPVHAATLDAAFARLDAAGVKYDRAEVAASLRCPICGCSIISSPEALDPARGTRPPF